MRMKTNIFKFIIEAKSFLRALINTFLTFYTYTYINYLPAFIMIFVNTFID